MSDHSLVLQAQNLEKTYGSKTRALDGVSLGVEKGTVFGLLGPNGAGKTTFVRIISTQLLPSGGSALILGYDVVREPQMVRRRIAIVPQESRPLSLQTPFEHIVTYLVSRGLDFSTAKKRADATLASLNLKSYRNTICANLSGGLRQRVLIAMAMSSEADLLVLDEPTIGLDPVARVDVWNLIRKYVAEGKTILLTTHYMDEAEELSDNLAIVNKGKVVSKGTPSQIRKRLNATHTVIIKTPETDLSEYQSFGKVLRAGTGVRVLTLQDGASELASICLKKNLEVSPIKASLEDVFISEVGEIEPEAAD
ncbi:MAG: ABC transporter ATP-binding protein [Thaumarchaeota archaeon]|nr:ABC transporter ATP-binding protein [Nitrososphaerota archaeon]